jgi:hypothetical protein
LPELAELWRRREPDLMVHDPGGRRECLVRAGELIVPADSVVPAMRRLDRWVDRVELAEEDKLATLRLRPGAECVELATEAAADLPVAANHVHLLGAGSVPREADPPPAPPVHRWSPPVTIAVLDTGLDPHLWFADQLAGHGTFVAGVLLRHAPGVTIRHRRVLSAQGLTDDRTVAAALRAVRGRAAQSGEHLDIVLLTAGCHTVDDRCPPLLAREISRFAGAVVVAAGGNNGSTRPFWPAALPKVLSAGTAAPRVAAEIATLLHDGHSPVDACRTVR